MPFEYEPAMLARRDLYVTCFDYPVLLRAYRVLALWQLREQEWPFAGDIEHHLLVPVLDPHLHIGQIFVLRPGLMQKFQFQRVVLGYVIHGLRLILANAARDVGYRALLMRGRQLLRFPDRVKR